MSTQCILCEQDGGPLLWRDALCRIVRASTEAYPGFLRVVLNRHVREMTDLTPADQQHLMSVVFACERVVRKMYNPDKVNLASFGNQVAHMHWHVIARHFDDAHFPDPSWGPPRRESPLRGAEIEDDVLRSEFTTELE